MKRAWEICALAVSGNSLSLCSSGVNLVTSALTWPRRMCSSGVKVLLRSMSVAR